MTAQPEIAGFKPVGPHGFHKALAKHTGFLISRLGLVAQKRFAELLE